MTESQLTRQFLQLWRETYPDGVAFKINDHSTGGIPDAVLMRQGRTVWIEFKARGKKLTPLQVAQRKKMVEVAKATVYKVWLLRGRTAIADFGLRIAPDKLSWRALIDRL